MQMPANIYHCCFLNNTRQNSWSRLQDLVEFDVAAAPMDLDVPCARAAHFPPNLTTLSLQYIVGWPMYIDVPDGSQVWQQIMLQEFPL